MALDHNKENEIRNKCVRKLSFMMRTSKEMRDFLKGEMLEDAEIESIISYLYECGYLDDERYALEFYLKNKRRGKATDRIRKEAKLKGISDEIFSEMLIKVMDDEEYSSEIPLDYDAALEIGLKMKNNQLEDHKEIDQKFLARVGRRLAGLGYRQDIIYKVIEKLR